MVKSYLRYISNSVFGIITTGSIEYNNEGTSLLTAGNEFLLEWDVRRQTKKRQLRDQEHNATLEVVCVNPINSNVVACGYSDGSIKLWNLKEGRCTSTLNGHRNSVTTLKYNTTGSMIVSGSKDTTIIVWDAVSETGLYKLRGHKDMICDCKFLEKRNYIISCSKDSLIKIWDLETQHCIQTIVTHRGEVWSCDINKDETRLITGSNDNFLRIWSLNKDDWHALNPDTINDNNSMNSNSEQTKEMVVEEEEYEAKYIGSIERVSKERVNKIRYHNVRNSDVQLVVVQSADNLIEIYKCRSFAEVQLKLKKRKNKLKKKNDNNKDEMETNVEDKVYVKGQDEMGIIQMIQGNIKIKSFAISPTGKQIAVTNINNSIQIYDISNFKVEKLPIISTIELQGHRSDVRDVTINKNNNLLLTTSKDSIKIWNLNNNENNECICTMESGYGLCSLFVPGDQYVIIGTKTGKLEVYEITSARMIKTIVAHEGAIWTMDLNINESGFITGSADKSIKFWSFELQDNENNGKELGIELQKSVSMTDDVLCVKYSPNGKLIAVALLDTTIKLFYVDSFKFYLSLYGHKLPVMSISISSDSNLLVSASADKNIKIWGLDFGDCHKSIFAHEDSIMNVKFVQNTHYFWSCGKDGLLKYWDADKFEQIQVLTGHQGPIWSLIPSADGSFIVTVSQDKTIRIWIRTDEPLYLEEERENALESMLDSQNNRDLISNSSLESTPPSKQTVESIKASERLLEAIETVDEHNSRVLDYKLEYEDAISKLSKDAIKEKEAKGEPIIAPLKENPLLLGLTTYDYLYKKIKEIKSNDLEESLIILPYNAVVKLFHNFDMWIKQGKNIELISRCVFYLLKVHHNQIVLDKNLLPLLDSIKQNTRNKLVEFKDTVGFNRSAMRYLKRSIEANTNTYFFEASVLQANQKKSKF